MSGRRVKFGDLLPPFSGLVLLAPEARESLLLRPAPLGYSEEAVEPLMLVLGFQATALLHRFPPQLVIVGSGLGLAALSGLFMILRRGMSIGGRR